MAAALPIRVFRAGTRVATFAHNTAAESALADPRVQPAPGSAAVPNGLMQRGVAVADAMTYSNGAVPGGDYDVVDRAPSQASTAAQSAGQLHPRAAPSDCVILETTCVGC